MRNNIVRMLITTTIGVVCAMFVTGGDVILSIVSVAIATAFALAVTIAINKD